MSIDWTTLFGKDKMRDITMYELPNDIGPFPERMMHALMSEVAAGRASLDAELARLEQLRELGIPRRIRKGMPAVAERPAPIVIWPDVHVPGEVAAYSCEYNNVYWDGDRMLISDHNVHELFPDDEPDSEEPRS